MRCLHPVVVGGVLILGIWVLLAGFQREVQRLGWAWTRPRNLALRNASETPRTLGVALSIGLSMIGLMAGVRLLEQESLMCTSWWNVPAWVFRNVLRVIGGRVAFGPGDLSSALVELNRHNNTWVGMSMIVWAGVVMFSPHLQALQWEVAGLVAFSCAMVHGALRATQLVRASHSQGLLESCIFAPSNGDGPCFGFSGVQAFSFEDIESQHPWPKRSKPS